VLAEKEKRSGSDAANPGSVPHPIIIPNFGAASAAASVQPAREQRDSLKDVAATGLVARALREREEAARSAPPPPLPARPAKRSSLAVAEVGNAEQQQQQQDQPKPDQ
jgi:hypothetical protein